MATFDRRDLMREAAASAGESQCAARSKQTGNRCKKSPMPGSNVCRVHGGAAPQVVAAAKRRLELASDRMASRLLHFAENDQVPAYVALQAVNSALDRANVVEDKQVSVELHTPFDQLINDVVSGSRADYRAAVGRPDPEPTGSPELPPGGSLPIVDAELVELGEAELVDAANPVPGEQPEHLADDDQDALAEAREHTERAEAYRRATETLANLGLTSPGGQSGYLDAETALEQAAQSNRNHRAQLRRR